MVSIAEAAQPAGKQAHPWLLADVWVPLPLSGALTYRVPPGGPMPQPGCRVVVHLGRQRTQVGLIAHMHHAPDADTWRNYRPLDQLLDAEPLVPPATLKLIEWVAEYCLCPPGQVLKQVLPPGLKGENRWVVTALQASLLSTETMLEGPEAFIWHKVTDGKELVIKGGQKGWTGPELVRAARRLRELGYVSLTSAPAHLPTARTETVLHLAPHLAESPEQQQQALAALARAPQQEAALLWVLASHRQGHAVTAAELRARTGVGASAVQALLVKGWLMTEARPVHQLDLSAPPTGGAPPPTDSQMDQAIAQLQSHLHLPTPFKPLLVQGGTPPLRHCLITHAARQALAAGGQVLLLLPHVAMAQVKHWRTALGVPVVPYHGRLTPPERLEVWQALQAGKVQVVVASRAGLWLPFTRLGLVVVDDEHHPAHKQHDPSPRLHARQAALVLARQHGAQALLLSRTPSLESAQAAQEGRYALLQLPIPNLTPALQVVDMTHEAAHKTSHGQVSGALADALRQVMQTGGRALVLKNRRGYAPFLVCGTCGHTPQCYQCSVSLTYHKADATLRCHQCGYTEPAPKQCAHCGWGKPEAQGMGTQRIEDQLQEVLPQARIGRMDADALNTKQAQEALVERFTGGALNLLVGTQMVTHAAGMPPVALAAVVQAENLWNQPDWRAHEHAYQLMLQLAERLELSLPTARLIIQTTQPAHPVLSLLTQPYEAWYAHELAQRLRYGYPPFCRLLRLEVAHRDDGKAARAAASVAALVATHVPWPLLGPEPAPVARLKGRYRHWLLIKQPKTREALLLKKSLAAAVAAHAETLGHDVTLTWDPDPQ